VRRPERRNNRHAWPFAGQDRDPVEESIQMNHRLLLTATLLAAFVGCEKNPPTTTPPPGEAPAADGGAADGGAADVGADAGAAEDGAADGGSTEPGAPDVAWKDKTFDQKKEFMGTDVFPKMKTIFKEHDAGTFGSFKCDTCHGPDPKARGYEMPTDSIYPLPKKDPVKAAMDYDEKVTKFMVDKVVPDMATLLELKPVNANGAPGEFGCFSCHPVE
jgi:hypothetical protein